MWLKFIKDTTANKRFDVVWVDDDQDSQTHINGGDAVRCLGPDGLIFEEAAPEVIIDQLAKEHGVSFKEEEDHLEKTRGKLKKNLKSQSNLGQYIDNKELAKPKIAE